MREPCLSNPYDAAERGVQLIRRAGASRDALALGYRFLAGLACSGARSLTGAVYVEGAPWWETPRRMRRLDQEIFGRGLPSIMNSP